MSIKTPDYNLSNYPEVYEPSEDSFLFLDALECEYNFLLGLKPILAAEIGSGSGIIIAALSSLFGHSCCYFATDINTDACYATKDTAKLNQSSVEALNMDLLGFFKCQFDLILFNTPYVVTEPGEMSGRGLNRAWAGGNTGREITDRVLHNLNNLLSSTGVCYMVLIKENNLSEVGSILEPYKLGYISIIDRKVRGEHLFVIKIYRINKLV